MSAPKKPCPAAEFRRIQSYYPALYSTGCTRDFCQSGRMTHTDEARVGHDPQVNTVEKDAVDFLQQCRRDGVIKNDKLLQARTDVVVSEIRASSIASIDGQAKSLPGHWTQSYDELEHGIRLAWKHARKCIMRSEYSYLKLKDLRHVSTSKEMGLAMLEGMHEAFNEGDIQPTVFAFPHRKPGAEGPVVWNQQLLAFAGYKQADDSILGDPASVALTEAFIELGWEPPALRTRWDLLPLVTQMNDDEPFMTPIPPEYFPLVPIRHPHAEHSLEFDKMGLRWVPAPALSQLGFDIGGVQYTGSPFIGWFMDAEIAVRNLADSFRYNMLPTVVKALKLLPADQELDDLPQSEKLALLSRAQSELNYAVNWSFEQAKVRMSDTLTASAMYTTFDDNHLKTHGFRLPADPYWIAPPEGSIVPIWHRGGAPNYQPKPMICRLKQDPVKLWRKRQGLIASAKSNADSKQGAKPNGIKTNGIAEHAVPGEISRKPRIHISYCSAGTTAQRLANKLSKTLNSLLGDTSEQYQRTTICPLNDLEWASIADEDQVFIIASSTGHGDVPINGEAFLQKLNNMTDKGGKEKVSFYVYGNGNSSYGKQYNGAGQKLLAALKNAGCALATPLFEGDTFKEDPPWRQFGQWCSELKEHLGGEHENSSEASEEIHTPDGEDDGALESLFDELTDAKIVSVHAPNEHGMKRVFLDVGGLNYSPMSHIDIFVPPKSNEIDELLWRSRLSGREEVEYGDRIMSTRNLISLMDPKAPFKSLQFVQKLNFNLSNEKAARLAKRGAQDAIEQLPVGWQVKAKLKRDGLLPFFSSLPIKQTRTFSAASAASYWEMLSQEGMLELLVQTHQGGQFTERFLSSAARGDQLHVRIRHGPGEHLAEQDKPLIAFTTGSGIAPLRGLLQAKCVRILDRQAEADKNDAGRAAYDKVSLFLGYSQQDEEMVEESVREAQALDLIDMLYLVPSNPEKKRAQDKMFEPEAVNRIRSLIRDEGANVFVCASQAAGDDFARNLEAIVGVDSIRKSLGERWVEEIYAYKPE